MKAKQRTRPGPQSRISLQGTLRRHHTEWDLELIDGGVLHGVVVEERNPTPKVGRTRWWVMKGHSIWIDRRPARERSQGSKPPGPPTWELPVVQGGAPGLGRNRQGEA